MKSSSHYTRLTFMIVGFLLSTCALAGGEIGGKGDAKAIEVANLPHFCWSQYIDDLPPDAEYRIVGCGVFTNHYCWGLVKLYRAKKLLGENKKKHQLLLGAKGDAIYTLNGMKNYPACAIRSHVETTLAQINAMLGTAK